jgi:type I restriction enzyme R subunit
MDTSETALETIIVDWLVTHNGYEQQQPHAFNKDFALVDCWVERFITETQKEKVEQSMCFKSPSERLKFFTRLSQEITKRGVTDVLRCATSVLQSLSTRLTAVRTAH